MVHMRKYIFKFKSKRQKRQRFGVMVICMLATVSLFTIGLLFFFCLVLFTLWVVITCVAVHVLHIEHVSIDNKAFKFFSIQLKFLNSEHQNMEWQRRQHIKYEWTWQFGDWKCILYTVIPFHHWHILYLMDRSAQGLDQRGHCSVFVYV